MKNFKENIIDKIKELIEIDKEEAEGYLITYFFDLDKKHLNDKELLKIKSSNGETLIDLAISKKLQYFLCLVIEKYTDFAKIKNKAGDTFLHVAARKGIAVVPIKALEIDPNLAKMQNKEGNTFLHEATGYALGALIDAFDVNPDLFKIRNKRGQTVLDMARLKASRYRCSEEFLEFLKSVDKEESKKIKADLNERKAQKLGEDRR